MPKNILKYFPNLTPVQQEQFMQMQELYAAWNTRINVVSRKDIDNLYEHHILHSLSLAKAFQFLPGTEILDLGTGGGFPGIPLAVMFPKCRFTLIDGTRKKIFVTSEVVKALHLDNVIAVHRRGEEEHGVYDFLVSRAVMPLVELHRLMRKNISKNHRNAQMNGIMVLKGGNIDAEIQPFRNYVEVTRISSYFDEEWFKGKYIIYLPC